MAGATLVAVPSAAHAATTSITVDGTSAGRTFDGIGAISGGGGNSRLLIDYPEPERSQILDYLFKPGYGAALQILKVEIGGDTNSTDGSESSIEHTSGSVDCTTGYEWWLMEQAKARNPGIKLYGLAWGAPGWVGSTFWTTATINYLVSWLGCAASHGLTVDYLGGWNERGYNISWYEQLRSTLDSSGYSSVKIVGADSDWSIANDVQTNSAFAASVDVIGAHYPCGGDGGAATTCSTTSNALATGKPLWASENGSQDEDSGAPALIRSITRGYTDAKMTAYINWPLAAGIYANLGYETTGLMVANSPWSGWYDIGAETWATAQVTQFTAPGWRFLDTGSGYLGGAESNGSYVTLKSTDGTDYSTILETTTASAAQTVTFSVTGGLSAGAVHVWSTDLASNNPATYLVHASDVTPSSGSYTLTLQPGYVYTVTTTTGQGKGTAQPPAKASLALPYSDSFDSTAGGQSPAYLSDQDGSFQAEPCTGRSGECVRQMAAQAPVNWDNPANPYTTLGDLSWTDYTVAADALMEQAGSVQLLARVNTQHPFSVAGIKAYYLQLSSAGAWSIVKNTYGGTLTTLASGTVAAPGTGTWHHLALTASGSTLTAAIDGTTVGSASDSSYPAGQVGLGIGGWQTDQFDNLSITPVGGSGANGGAPVAATYQLLNRNSGLALAVSGGSTSSGALIVQSAQAAAGSQQWQLLGEHNGYDKLVNVASGLALDVPSSSTAQGTQLDQWSDNGGANQAWSVVGTGTGYYTLTNENSGMVADVTGDSASAGAAVIQWPAAGAANQQWQLVAIPEPNATYTLVDKNSGMLADISGGSTSNGGLLLQWVPNGGLNQQWRPGASGSYWTLLNVNSGLLLEVPNNSTTQGTQLDQWSANGGANQQWSLTPAGNGAYTLVNHNSGMLADVNGASTQENATVIQWPSNGGANQQWYLTLDY
ncbi:MAG TPA: RICIN domain-containing protein [Actinocrinis sp.]|uniref:RICIN domain-containing protein n=1 Tax=Actinocrinis sp. TaxID=1920516 RepID=UPI002DDD40E6|nr:RICIN domain-containing protein [Actinocrinis sp.]HEV2342967.1 RICIN domain-containing protein [Actinocrinis sp.]